MKLFNEKLTNFLVTKHGVKKNDTFTYSNCGKLKNKGNLGVFTAVKRVSRRYSNPTVKTLENIVTTFTRGRGQKP